MITELSSNTHVRPSKNTGEIKSRWGLGGTLLLLLMLPLAVLYQLIFDSGIDTFVHVVLATGSLCMAIAVRDFIALPKWIQWVGGLSASLLALIMFLQGLSHVVQSNSLTYVAYDLLGPTLEPWSLYLYLFVWGGALLLRASQGMTKILGVVTLLSVLAMELYRYSLVSGGATAPDALRVIYLLPFVWLLFESTKKS